MAIIANVVDGKLEYEYTDNSKKTNEPAGSEMGYDQFLQLLCAEMQHQDPLEPTTNTDYVAQMATFSQLEATLSLADAQQNNVANGLVGKQVILKVENETTGKTEFVDGKVDYVMYENGETLLSVNNGLYPISSLDTVADSDYYEATGLAKTFSNMITQLPGIDNMQSVYKGAIQDVRDVYESMTDYQKTFVNPDDLKILENVEAKLKELLKAEEESSKADGEAEGSDATEGTQGVS